MFFLPSATNAGLFSTLLGNEASADIFESINSLDSILTVKNSQTLALLQVDNSSVPIMQNLQDKKEKKDEIKEDNSVNIVSEMALLPTTSHMTALNEVEAGDSYSDQISVYVVRKGDSLSEIAEMFDVSVNTILWANDMKKSDKLIPGDTLFILPISGLEHTITKGQTLKSIAKIYKADISDIALFNGIAEDTKLNIGDKIIIPDGEMYVESSSSNNKSNQTITPTKNIPGYFINPAPGTIRTQRLHGKNAVDLAAPIGTPIYAAASGTVLLARMGWNGGYGGLVIIQHSNGTKTVYGHLSGLNTSAGQKVLQGQKIARMGNTGHVRPSAGGTGSHLHFEVQGAKNPGGTTPMSWAPWSY